MYDIFNVNTNQFDSDNLYRALSSDRAGILFSVTPPAAEANQYNRYPFEVVSFSPSICGHKINLYSQFSRSRPYQKDKNKYNHLLPQWRFTDENFNIIESLDVNTIVYHNGEAVGTTGISKFFYKDDMPSLSGYPCLLWATLNVQDVFIDNGFEKQNLPSYANSKVIAVQPYYINGPIPEYLDITSNGITDIPITQWQDIPFNYTITIRGAGDNCNNNNSEDPIIFDYPNTNEIGLSATNEIYRDILKVSAVDETWVNENAFFQRTDGNFYVGGFNRGSTSSNTSALNTNISAAVSMQYDVPYRASRPVWISNPNNTTLNKIDYQGSITQSVISEITSVISHYDAATVGFTSLINQTPYITSIPMTNVWSYSGYGGIFGIAMDSCDDVWVTDGEMDAIYKFNSKGTLISSIGLLSATTPAGIALNSEEDIWVTLLDSVSVLKYSNGNLVSAIAPSMVEDDIVSPYNYIYAPAAVAIDGDDNLWVTYSNIFSSYLIKYDGDTGTELNNINIELSSTPIDVIVDGADDSIWVTKNYGSLLSAGSVDKYSTDGVLISSHNFVHPVYITLDVDKTVWFTYGYNNVGYIHADGSTGYFSISNENVYNSQNVYESTDTILGGIAADQENKIWIINSQENNAYIISDTSSFNSITASLDILKINPDSNKSWYIDYSSGSVQYVEFTDINNKSATAFADWTGWRWQSVFNQNKINPGETLYLNLTGISNEFNIYPFELPYDIRRFNESWDIANQMESYAIPEHNKSNFNLFMNYLKGMVGGLESEGQQIGRVAYEKIANYNQNHSDIDTSNIDQLYNLSQFMDVPIDDYNFEFPFEIARWMDIFSIDHRRLWGQRCQCTNHYLDQDICKICGHSHPGNKGDAFSPETYILTAGVPFLVTYNIGSDDYYILEPTVSGPLTGQSSVAWLNSGKYLEYCYFDYITTPCNVQVEGIINWADDYTTLTENNSSLSAWFDTDGIIERILNYQLHKGLNLDG